MALWGWWKPKCPLGYQEKGWVEVRMGWLIDAFGLQNAAYPPADVSLLDESHLVNDGTVETAQRVFENICRILPTGPVQRKLEIVSHDAVNETATADMPHAIRIDACTLADPLRSAAVMACAIARDILHERNFPGGGLDLHWTADLMTVVFGMGLVTANATLQETMESSGRHCRCKTTRHGFLSARTIGYAMALRQWVYDEPETASAGLLRLDASQAYWQGLKYLTKTGDSVIQTRRWDPNPPLPSLINQLHDGTLSARFAALWMLAERGEPTRSVAEAVATCLDSHHAGIRSQAARTLAQLGDAAATAMPVLVDALADSEPEVREAVIYALGRLRLQPDVVVPLLVEDIEDRDVAAAIWWALGQFGEAVRCQMPRLRDLFRHEIEANGDLLENMVDAIPRISPEPEFQQIVGHCDPDVRPQVAGVLASCGPVTDAPGSRGWWMR